MYLGSEHINETMVRQGYAMAAEYPPDTAHAADFAAAQNEAVDWGRGIWGECIDTSPPSCDPSYPTVCIPPPPPDLDCGDITFRRFKVLQPDPHRFDGDKDKTPKEAIRALKRRISDAVYRQLTLDASRT